MGKRKKSSRGPVKKAKQVLDTTFKCVFCSNENSVNVKMDKKMGVGNLNCKNCGQSFQTSVHYLSAPVDVYSDWVDACETVAKDTASGPAAPPTFSQQSRPAAASTREGLAPGEKYTEEDAGFIDDDDDEGFADPEE